MPLQRPVAAVEAYGAITLGAGGAQGVVARSEKETNDADGTIPDGLAEDQCLHKERVLRWQHKSRGG